MLIPQSKRVEGQIQGTQDKSEKVKSEVRHKNLGQYTKLSDDRKRLYKYRRRLNNHKQERLREAERIPCTTKMIPSVNESSLYPKSCVACPLETSKLKNSS
jgi:division protein CdvB (Snf7/Vps24/ESCRT-III family)